MSKHTIFSLHDLESNTIKNTTTEINRIVYNFYFKLYNKEYEDISLQDEFLNKLMTKISEEDKELLEKTLEEEEIFTALSRLNDDKSLGPDGITKEWYLHFWSKIKTHYIKSKSRIVENYPKCKKEEQ